MSRPIGVSAIGSASLGGAAVPGLISVGQGYGGAAYGATGYANSALIATTVTVSTQTIVAVGIGSAEAFGLPVFVPGPVTVVPIGVPGIGDINTLWGDSVTPGTVDSTDTGSVVLGLSLVRDLDRRSPGEARPRRAAGRSDRSPREAGVAHPRGGGDAHPAPRGVPPAAAGVRRPVAPGSRGAGANPLQTGRPSSALTR